MSGSAMQKIIPFPTPPVRERAPERNDLAKSAACLSAALNCLSVALADQQAASRPPNAGAEGYAATHAEPGGDEGFKDHLVKAVGGS